MKCFKLAAFLLLVLLISRNSTRGTTEEEISVGKIILENATARYGISSETPTFGASSFDFNSDGWPDLFISNHGKPPSIFLNINGEKFTRTQQRFPHLRGSDRHAPAFADCDNDGDQDLYLQHGALSGTGLGPKEFFNNLGQNKPYARRFLQPISDPPARGRT